MASTRSLCEASPAVRSMLDAWLTARNGALVPLKKDFDPFSVPRWLPGVWIARFDPARDDFLFTLSGERVNLAWRGSLKHKALRELIGAAAYPEMRRRWRAVVETPQIQYAVLESETERPDASSSDPLPPHLDGERLMLPLASEPDRVDQILGFSQYRITQTDPDLASRLWSRRVVIPCSDLETDAQG